MQIYVAVVLALFAVAQGGVVRSDVNPHILGGSNAYQGQFPWIVYITMDNAGFCGGTVISQDWVLTMAHCVDSVKSFLLVFGNLLPGGEEGSNMQFAGSRNVVAHPRYNEDTIENNIAVIRLDKPLVFTPSVKAVTLPSYSQIGTSFAGMDATVSGWGKTSYEAAGYANILKWVDLPVISNSLCDVSYHSIMPGNICASGLNGRSTCIGDSGSPLVLRQSSGDNGPLIGILSYDYLNCERDYPAVFTRITFYLDWIHDTTLIGIAP